MKDVTYICGYSSWEAFAWVVNQLVGNTARGARPKSPVLAIPAIDAAVQGDLVEGSSGTDFSMNRRTLTWPAERGVRWSYGVKARLPERTIMIVCRDLINVRARGLSVLGDRNREGA